MSARAAVAAARARELRLGAEATIAWCLALIFAALATAAIVLGGGRWIGAPRWLPLAMTLAFAGGALTIAMHGMRVARARADAERVAERIERERGLRSGALVAGMQLDGRNALAAAGISALDAQLARAKAPRVDAAHSRFALARPLGALALAAGLLALAAPSRRDGIAAMLRPVQAWRGSLLPPLAIADAPRAVRRGGSFSATLVAPGRKRLTLRERQTGTAWSERVIELDGAGRATVRVGPVNGDVALLANDGRVSTPETRVAAVDRAYLGTASITITPPTYLGGAVEHAVAGMPIRVARGSGIAIAALATVELRSAALVSPRDTIVLATAGQRATGRFTASADNRWEWRAISAAGDTLDAPAAIDLSVVADSAPSIAIAAPLADTIVATEATVTLRLIASDDHGLSAVRLDVAPNGGQRSSREVARSLPARWGADVGLDVASLGLGAGDATRLTAVAVDNSPWAQTGSSRTVVIRVPGATEQRERVRAAADSLVASAASVAVSERDLARRTGEASRDRGERSATTKAAGSSSGAAAAAASARPRDAMSYESEQRARAVHEEQQKLSSNVAAMKQRAAELQKQLDRAGALDSSLAAQLRDAQKLMQEAITPELAASLAALDSAVQSRNADAARSSLADLAKQQEQLRQQLDRIAEMLSRAAIEGSLKTLHDEARDIATAERQRADSAGAQREDPSKLQDRASKVGKEASALADRLRRAGGDESAAQTSQASAHAKQSAEALGRPDGARSAAGEMDKAADALAGARKQQISAWKSELAGELDRSIQEMMQLAQGERSLEEQSRQGAGPSSLRSEQSALQQGVEKTSERLEKAGRASSLLSSRSRAAVAEARRQSTRATGETARPQQEGGRGAQDAFGNAADALTRAAAALVRDRERVNSSETATGFADMLKEMQQLAKQQGALNAQAASLFQMPGTGGAGSAQARALAKQQREVARSLEELGNSDGSGRADALAAEARRVAQALEQGEASEATRQRQEELLRRMLDAGRSLQGEERDEGKREATSASGVELFNPGTGDASGAAARRWREPTWEELRGLSAEERRAVIDYFRRMNAEAKP